MKKARTRTLFRGGGYYKCKIPFWCIDTTTCRLEIDRIIRQCDKAFDCPISGRGLYSVLLQKIHQKGIFIYAYSEEVLGYTAIYANDADKKAAYISLIAVRPEAQSLHIGKNLLYTGMETALAYGMDSCALEVEKSNSHALKFYQSNGFVFQKDNGNSIYMHRRLY